MELDLRTLFITSTFLNIALTIYLFIFWVGYRKEFKGISYFFWAMVLLTLGIGGIALQGKINPFFSIVISNSIIILGIEFIYLALRLFFHQKFSKFIIIFLIILFVATLIEQYVFSIIYDNLQVRIIAMSLFLFLSFLMCTFLMIKVRDQASLPGVLFIGCFGMLSVMFLFRIQTVLTIPPPEGQFINTSGFMPAVVLFFSVITSGVPFGFALLISYQLQIKERIRSKEKSVLLRELYHRTKNNMQLVISLLHLQRNYADSLIVKEQLQEAESKIQSIILVHKKLYESKNLSSLSLKEYINDLLNLIIDNYNINSKEIALDIKIDDITVLIDIAVPIGLMLNELLINIFKYAFPEDKGKIKLNISQKDNAITIFIKDNGVGVPGNFDFFNTETLGLPTVINIVQKQLGGTIKFNSDNGLSCSIKFENVLYKERV